MGECAHVTYNASGPPNDEGIIACAKGYDPEVIFYIGSNSGIGIPTTETLKKLRDYAPCIHYQSDVEDEAWFDLLRQYRSEGCFDLIVSQTGVKTDLIDMASLMAVDIDSFNGPAHKNIQCGFSGSALDTSEYKPGISDWDGRAEILYGLGDKLAFRKRAPVGNYANYVDFLKHCLITLNVSLTGSGKRHHVKWRVLEAAFADCVLLEMKDSPTSQWFPRGSYLTYKTAAEARRIIMNMRVPEATAIAAKFASYARQHYTPRQIFNNILERLPK